MVVVAAFQKKKSCVYTYVICVRMKLLFNIFYIRHSMLLLNVDIIPTKIIVIKKFQRSCTFIMYYKHFVGVLPYSKQWQPSLTNIGTRTTPTRQELIWCFIILQSYAFLWCCWYLWWRWKALGRRPTEFISFNLEILLRLRNFTSNPHQSVLYGFVWVCSTGNFPIFQYTICL